MREMDPYFYDIPWDLIYDESGELIGEVYLILPKPPPCKQNFNLNRGRWLNDKIEVNWRSVPSNHNRYARNRWRADQGQN